MPPTVGVDGCRAGWIAVMRHAPDEMPVARIFPRFAFLLDATGPDAVIAVDMPIGLPERIECAGQAAEKAVRPLLGERRSSVFSIPARAAVEAGAGPFRSELHRREMHVEACRIAEHLSHPPRRVSIQGFGLFPKIMEIDRLLGADPGLAERVIESHPEFAFRILAGGSAMSLPKKIKGRVNPAGMDERRRLLVDCGLPRALLDAPPPAGADEDDLLDACAMLLVAERYRSGTARPYPDPPERDGRGLPIAIWA
jgi:predicted RNase H-like nuclease